MIALVGAGALARAQESAAATAGVVERFLALRRADDVPAWQRRLKQESARDAASLMGGLAQTYSIFAAPDRRLVDWQRGLLVEALATRDAKSIDAYVRGALDCPDAPRQAAGLRLLSGVGNASDVPRFVHALERAWDSAYEASASATVVEAELARLLEREPQALASLVASAARVGAPSNQSVLRAAGASRRPEALALFARALDWPDYPPAMTLAELARALPQAPPWVKATLEAAVLERARDDDPAIRQAAILVLGRIRSKAAIELLLELSEHELARVADSASWALEQVTGLGLRRDPVRWRAWWQEEQAWLASAREKFEAARADDDVPGLVAQLHALWGHAWAAREFQAELATLLNHSDVRVRKAALLSIERTQAGFAVEQVVELVEDPEADLRPLAVRVLVGLCGEQADARAPADAGAWREHLSGQKKRFFGQS